MVVAVTRTSGAYSAKARMGAVAKFLAQFGTRALCLKEPLRFLKERCRKVVYFGHLTSLCSSLLSLKHGAFCVILRYGGVHACLVDALPIFRLQIEEFDKTVALLCIGSVA